MPITSPQYHPTYFLSWTPIYDASSYDVERTALESFDGQIEPIYSGDRTSIDTRSSGIGTFYYRVRARNLAGVSQWSQAQSASMTWETEPNNVLTQANEGIAPGVTIYALPNDANDFFKITATELGTVTAAVDGMVGQSVRLALYYDNIGNLRAADTAAPYAVTALGPAGDYYVRVFVGAGYSVAIPYRLTVSYK
jgi:hypothetical protein